MAEVTFLIHRAEEGGYWARAESLSIFTQAESLDELERNIREALQLYFEDPASELPTISWRFVPDQVAA